MDHLFAIRDLGIADPATDTAAEDAGRATLFAEIDRAGAVSRSAPARRAARLPRRAHGLMPALGVGMSAAAAVIIAVAAAGGSSTSSLQAQNTAYIVHRVSANLGQAGQGEVNTSVESGGNGNPGSDVVATGRWYTDPDSGVQYSSDQMAQPDGTVIYEQYTVGTPVNGRIHFVYTALDPQQHLYAISSDTGPDEGPTPDPAADAQQIRSELNSGKVTQEGTATVDGQPTIKLSFPAGSNQTGTLYVNARTYEPVPSSSTMVVDAQNPTDGTDTNTEIWQPATTTNVAQVKLAQIPAGYTQVSVAELHRANPASR